MHSNREVSQIISQHLKILLNEDHICPTHFNLT